MLLEVIVLHVPTKFHDPRVRIGLSCLEPFENEFKTEGPKLTVRRAIFDRFETVLPVGVG